MVGVRQEEYANYPHIEHLFSSDFEKCHRAVTSMRNAVIGSRRQKHHFVQQGVVPRLIQLLSEESADWELRVAAAYAICSIGKGDSYLCNQLIESHLMPALFACLQYDDNRLVEACLCCLKIVFLNAVSPPVDMIYSDDTIIPLLLNLMVLSTTNRISVAIILSRACDSHDQQSILVANNAIQLVAESLTFNHPDIQTPAVKVLAMLVYKSEKNSSMFMSHTLCDRPLLEWVTSFLERNRDKELQLAAARCLAYLFRMGRLSESDPRIVFVALPCLVRLTKKGNSNSMRTSAALNLAYMIEASEGLQRLAAISNHLIPSLALFIWDEGEVHASSQSPIPSETVLSDEDNWSPKDENSSNVFESNLPFEEFPRSNSSKIKMMSSKCNEKGKEVHEMKVAAFQVFAALGANDEVIRKKLIDTKFLLECLVFFVSKSGRPHVQRAAINCLHSLTRSVQLLRTAFQDNDVWKHLVNILASPSSSVDFLFISSSTLCNLLLEFCPSKEFIVEAGVVNLLSDLTHKSETCLRLNGVWGLMNLAFHADHRLRVIIIQILGSDQIFRLLSDQDVGVVMKTLGLLRNLLTIRHQIDLIMCLYGKQIMQALVLILESDNGACVKEQALCVLINIADGDSAKSFIMSNEDVLKKIGNYMMHTNPKLQTAAVMTVFNLSVADDSNSHLDRQSKLKEIGVVKILNQLLSTKDPALLEKVRLASECYT